MSYQIAGQSFQSRLMVGTGKYPSLEIMRQAHLASGTQIVTVAIRRIDLGGEGKTSLLDYLDLNHVKLLPNTAGCYTVKDAVDTAFLAREALKTPWIKLEVIGDEKTLLPDNEALLEATRLLVREGFVVLPYISDDLVLCRKLEDLGCAAVMPLAAPIGSGLGILNPRPLQWIIESIKIPVIVDAGVGVPSDAARAMELGATAVLMNTAIAGAKDPVKMAEAMRQAVTAGRLAYEAGPIPKKSEASPSSPTEGKI